ncbi:MAG: HAD-IA family hydrolase [Alphaproteobacteria bacterium]
MTHCFRLIVFDFDGTLVDSLQFIVTAMSRAFADQGLVPPEPAAVRRIVGLRLEAAAARLLPDPQDMATAECIAGSYRAAFQDMRARNLVDEPLYPGVRETLALLNRPEVCLGVATGKSRHGLVSSLERHDLSELFVTLQTADDGPGKPHPEILHRAMAEAGAEPEETVMIGDTSYDMEMAVNAGVSALGVDWGYHGAEELRASGAAHVAETFPDLPAKLANLS